MWIAIPLVIGVGNSTKEGDLLESLVSFLFQFFFASYHLPPYVLSLTDNKFFFFVFSILIGEEAQTQNLVVFVISLSQIVLILFVGQRSNPQFLRQLFVASHFKFIWFLFLVLESVYRNLVWASLQTKFVHCFFCFSL